MSRSRVVIGVIREDIHIVGNRIMQLAVEECGFSVYNLRTRNRPERFAQAALEVNAHAVVVSSLNGEGEYWCSDFRKRFSAVGLNNILLYVGGNIVVGKRSQEEVIALFKGFGFDRVYHQVGIVCLTEHFSGATLRNQVLMAGADPVFVCGLDDHTGNPDYVDIVIVGGGIDCAEAAPLEQRLRRFDASKYRFSALTYAGNRYYADLFLELFPRATVIVNPLSEGRLSKSTSVFEAIRRAYLDDLIHKQGIGDLRKSLSKTIRPTPEVFSHPTPADQQPHQERRRAFRSLRERSDVSIST